LSKLSTIQALAPACTLLLSNCNLLFTKQLIPTYGYSKEGRSDLNQVILLLATTGKANLPIFMASQSGNASYKTTISKAIERAKNFAASLILPLDFLYIGKIVFLAVPLSFLLIVILRRVSLIIYF